MIKYYHLEDGFTPTDNYTEGDWIHLEGHEKKELEQITDRFDIPANLLADIYDIDERPRVDSGQGWTLVIIRIPRKRDGQKLHFATVPLFLIFKGQTFISICSYPTDALTDFLAYTKTKKMNHTNAHELVVHLLMNAAVWFMNYTKTINDETSKAEAQMLHNIRNDDLHWVLNRSQYGHFIQAAHFFRPVYVSGGRWNFRIYLTYTNHKHFYYPCPPHYKTYCGAHARPRHNHVSYYKGRYHHAFYAGNFRIRDGKHYHFSRRSDFGSIRLRPGSSKAPDWKAPSRPKPKPEKAPVKVIRPKKDKDKAPAHRPSREPSRKEQNDRASSNSIRKRA